MPKYIDSEAALRDWPLCDEPGDAYQFIKNFPAADVVARDCYNRILKENDTMREQLAQIGKKPGDSMDGVRPVRSAKKIKFYNDPWTERKFTTCAACHWKVGPHDKFCKHCGAKFEEAST